MTLSRTPQCRAFSRAVMVEKSLSCYSPWGWGVGGGGAVVSNDWCITCPRFYVYPGYWQSLKQYPNYNSIFRENRCPPLPKPVYSGKFSHEAVTLKIRSRSPKSIKLLILSDLYRRANLVTFHTMVH